MRSICLMLLLHLTTNTNSQNVGIGTTIPAAPLHIKSTDPEILLLDGNIPYISFYNLGLYKGYLWYDGLRMVLGTSTNESVVISANYNSTPAYFTPNGRLGLGTPNPTERLDVNGNINLSGLIKVNGSEGTAGQVLTSNGAADPTWTNAAYINSIRFAVNFFTTTSVIGDMPISAVKYNLNPSVVSIGATTITVLQSGLYHIDVVGDVTVNFASAPSFYPRWNMNLVFGPSSQYGIFPIQVMHAHGNSNLAWSGTGDVSIELYITAPATISLGYFLSFSGGTSYSAGALMTGHLISQ